MLLDYKKRDVLWDFLNAKADFKEFMGSDYEEDWFGGEAYYGQSQIIIDKLVELKNDQTQKDLYEIYHIASVVAYNEKQKAKIKHFCQMYDTLTNLENVTGKKVTSVVDYGGGIGTDILMWQSVGIKPKFYLVDRMPKVRKEFIQFRAKKYGLAEPECLDLSDDLPVADFAYSIFALEYGDQRSESAKRFASTSDSLAYLAIQNKPPISAVFGEGKHSDIQSTLEGLGYKRLRNKPYYPTFMTKTSIDRLY